MGLTKDDRCDDSGKSLWTGFSPAWKSFVRATHSALEPYGACEYRIQGRHRLIKGAFHCTRLVVNWT
jgi:hypothetical protein